MAGSLVSTRPNVTNFPPSRGPALHHGKPGEVGFPSQPAEHCRARRSLFSWREGRSPSEARRKSPVSSEDSPCGISRPAPRRPRRVFLPRASSTLCSVPKRFITRGKSDPSTFSNRRAGPAFLYRPRRYLRYLKIGRDLGLYSPEVACSFKMAYEALQIGKNLLRDMGKRLLQFVPFPSPAGIDADKPQKLVHVTAHHRPRPIRPPM